MIYSAAPELIAAAIVVVFVIALIAASVRVLREYERGVVFRLGRLLGAPKGPGLFLLIPIVDRMVRVDLRTVTLVVPPQDVITKDNVPAKVNAVAYFRVVDPTAAIVEVADFSQATLQIAQTTLRSVLGSAPPGPAALRTRARSTRSCRRSSTSRPRHGGSRSSVVEVRGRRDPFEHAAGDGAPG